MVMAKSAAPRVNNIFFTGFSLLENARYRRTDSSYLRPSSTEMQLKESLKSMERFVLGFSSAEVLNCE